MNSQNKKILQVSLFVIVAILVLGIGYASINAINFIFNGNATVSVNQENFKVYFVQTGDTPSISGNVPIVGTSSIDPQDNTKAVFDISGLTKEGDYATSTYTVLNNSNNINAQIKVTVYNTNEEYFKITETIDDDVLEVGESTTVTIKVELIKTPMDTDVSTTVESRLIAKAYSSDNLPEGNRTTIESGRYVYTRGEAWINNSLSDSLETYNTYEEAVMQYGVQKCLAHKLRHDIVEESYIAVKKSDNYYYIRGGVDESSLSTDNMINYNENKRIADTLYSNCSESTENNIKKYSCSAVGYADDNLQISSNGTISMSYYINDTMRINDVCTISDSGRSSCTYTESVNEPS